ncbi:MAG: hypothetical protein ABI548_24655 [Polyangiaceae bacterium]
MAALNCSVIGERFFDLRALSQAQITNHYVVMTGKLPSGSCANSCSFQGRRVRPGHPECDHRIPHGSR